VLLATAPTALPMAVTLALNFRVETLELVLNLFGQNRQEEKCTKRWRLPAPIERRASPLLGSGGKSCAMAALAARHIARQGGQ